MLDLRIIGVPLWYIFIQNITYIPPKYYFNIALSNNVHTSTTKYFLQ